MLRSRINIYIIVAFDQANAYNSISRVRETFQKQKKENVKVQIPARREKIKSVTEINRCRRNVKLLRPRNISYNRGTRKRSGNGGENTKTENYDV